ncbi:MAG: phage holin family protein [Thermoanaerobaculia bacterium]
MSVREPGERPGNHAARLAAEERKSVPALVRELVDEARGLIRNEIDLAKAETRETVEVISRNLAALAIGFGIGLAAILAFAAALNRGLTSLLSRWMEVEVTVWLAPLILGVVFALVSAALIAKAIRTIRQQHLVPERTRETLEDDKEWLLEKTH